MNHRPQNNRNDDRKEDPPYSRVFIVCSKDLHEEDLREPFEKYGDIEDLHMPRDRNTGEHKGVAYIKYIKTSSAAAAIQELHMNTIPQSKKPLKVMIATNRSDKTTEIDTEKRNRLFIKIPKQATDSDIKQHFSQFAEVESVHIMKDKNTNESKGLAYVQFKSFLDAAKASEECDRKFKPVFATPKHELKRGRDSFDFNDSFRTSNSSIHKDNDSYNLRNDFYNQMNNRPSFPAPIANINALIQAPGQGYNTVSVTCSPMVSQTHLQSLFNIVPGMIQCQYSLDNYNGYCKATIKYDTEKAAAYAVERLNNFEFPSGEIVCVKPDNPLSKAASDLTNMVNSFKNAVDAGSPDIMQLANVIAQASTLIQAASAGKMEPHTHVEQQKLTNPVHDMSYCSVNLPPPQPIANVNSPVAQRCFIVCKPYPPPNNVLKDVFRRFGDLIDISTFPNKTFGFVKYASVRAAQDAINMLHGATVCGVTLKVLEADEKKKYDDGKDFEMHELSDKNSERKRMRLHDDRDMD